jgi:hypothetical protein
MKKLFFIATLVGTCGLVQATTISAPSSLVTGGLDGNSAYSWGITIPVPSGQTTHSGNSAGTGVLYTDLLNSHNPGLATATDNDAPGDYWATQYSGANIAAIGSQAFASVGTTLTWSYILTSSELTALNSYLAAGTFNIGIDPDCHFSVGGISFTYTLGSQSPPTVPDVAATAFLMVLGLAGLEIFRRQFVSATVKA